MHRRQWTARPGKTFLIAAAIFLGGVPSAFASPTYTVTDLGTLPGGTNYTPFAINSSGQIAGDYYTTGIGQSPVGPFLYSNGQMANVGGAAADGGPNGFGINDSGTMTQTKAGVTQLEINNLGDTISLNGTGNGYYLSQNGTTINLPAGFQPQSINDNTTIAGQLTNTQGSFAAIDNNGNVTIIGPVNSGASGINNAGHVVGSAGIPNVSNQQAFYFDGSQIHYLGTLGGTFSGGQTYSTANAINDQDQIVGTSLTGQGGGAVLHAFLSSGGGQMLDLNALVPPGSGWVLETASAINNSGVIVGWGLHNGQQRAFELTPIASPVPIPEPTVLMMAILAGGGFFGKRLAKLSRRRGPHPRDLSDKPLR